jgi:hypothetical protein
VIILTAGHCFQDGGLMKPYRFFRVYSRKKYNGEERRLKPRIYYPIPIRVRTTGCCGERLEFDTFADDLSAGGFSAHTTMEFQPGQKLFFVMRFSLEKGSHLEATTVAAHGIVLRSEKRFNGSYAFASTVDRHRFI